MKVGHETNRIIRFTFRQEKTDPDYGTCVWAHFDFDVDNYDLSIHSDCGCYGYGWTVTPSEPFLELMARIHSDYLLNKMCERSRVDWERTREALTDAMKDLVDVNFNDEDYDEAVEDLDILKEEYDLEGNIGAAEILIENWNEDHFRLDDVYEYVKTDWTGDQKKIVSVFEEYIQPAIREYLKEAET